MGKGNTPDESLKIKTKPVRVGCIHLMKGAQMEGTINVTVVSNNLKSARVKKGLLQDDVARLLGVSRQTVSNFERDPSGMTLNKFIRLADIYECPVSYFFGV